MSRFNIFKHLTTKEFNDVDETLIFNSVNIVTQVCDQHESKTCDFWSNIIACMRIFKMFV